ncbi:MAG: 23S rRNA (adenine(2503)-C(2))-methyltransferase RlmN [Spirochaetaceae bacterium]|jgi:23S rRNA (adenine2503-C2)-methyltransferase|nr:23S rRNA (adenine(2503)-C(2))-methyltransferase RlmN [Spirochaetaceae bacterium]
MMPQEIAMLLSPEKPFRGQQIFKWISAGVFSFDSMTNLPAELRQRLAAETVVCSASVSETLRDPDGTIKLKVRLHDGHVVETVLLVDAEGRKTACVSSQAGCPVGCAFCMTGKLGFARNLTAEEIVGQFLFLEAAAAAEKSAAELPTAGKLDNIVFMGMGEPLLNLEAVRRTIQVLTAPEGRNLSRRRITVSTAGIVKGIYDLADNGPEIRLAVSLTSACPDVRTALMPVTAANPLPALREAIRYFTEKTGRRCTLEAALLSGVTTTAECADALIAFARGLDTHVNLIPWNPVAGLPFSEPSGAETGAFMKKLERAGLNVTMRTRRGRKIGGACGQLGQVNGKTGSARRQ